MTEEEIKNRLEKKYSNSQIFVRDLTGTENHFEVSIIGSQFEELSHLERHRRVLSLFQPELKSGEIHALSLKIRNQGLKKKRVKDG